MKEINKRSLYQSCKRKVRYRDTAEVLKALRKCKQKRGEELDYYYGESYFTYPSDVSDEENVTDFSYGVHYKEMAQSVNKYGGFYCRQI